MRSAILALWALSAAVAADISWRPLREPGSGGAQTSLAVSPFDPSRVLVGGDMLGVGLSLDRGESWQPTAGFRSWEMASFTFHPEDPLVVWAGSMSGPYVSRDGGATWEERRAGMFRIRSDRYSAPVEKVLIDRTSPSRLLAFGGSHRRWDVWVKPEGYGVIWESIDGGETWSGLSTLPGNPNIVAAAADPALRTLYVAAAPGGIFRSGDGGASWVEANQGLPSTNVNFVAIHPEDPAVAWAALGNSKDGSQFAPGGIYKTTDGGTTWTNSSSGLAQRRGTDSNQTPRFDVVAVAPSDPGRLYTSDTSWNGATIYRSDDGGGSWRAIYTAASMSRTPVAYFAGPGMTVATVDPSDAGAAWFSGSEYILRTLDGGDTWTDVTALPSPGAPGYWLGRGFSGLVAVSFQFNPYQPGESALIAMDGGKFWKSVDHLQSWRWLGNDQVTGRPLPRWSGGNDAVFCGPSGSVIYATFGQFGEMAGIGRSRDGGITWTLLAGAARGLPALSSSNQQPAGIWAVPDAPDEVWAVIGGRLYESIDGGETWRRDEELSGLAWLAAHPSDPRTVFATGAAGVYRRATDGSWQLIPGSPANAGRFRIDPSHPEVLYVTVWRKNNAGLWRYQDGEWTRILDEYFARDVDVDPFNPSRIAVGTSDDPYHDHSGASGVWVSEDGGATWAPRNEGLAMLRVPVVRFDPDVPGRIVIGTAGRGYFVSGGE